MKSYKLEQVMKFEVAASPKQRQLEAQGCIFRGQELLDNHELDPAKGCYCGRPNKKEGT